MQTEKPGDSSPAIINDCTKIHAASKFYSYLGKRNVPKFTTHNYRRMFLLVELISYENVVLIDRKALCSVFGCRMNNLNRALSKLEHLIEYESPKDHKDIPTGYTRIRVNPAYGWCPSERITREEAIQEWYMTRDLSETSKKDFYISAQYQDLLDFT